MRLSHQKQLILAVSILTLVLHLLLGGTPAAAHGYIIRTLPQDQAVIERSPGRVQVWFSEGVEPKFSTINVTNDRGELIPLADIGVSPSNSTQLSARLPTDLPVGTYIIRIRAAFATDGHVINQTVVFWIGSRTDSGVIETAANREAIPLEVAWRSVQLPSLNVLFGVLLLYQFVLVPAWGNPRYKVGLLTPRVFNRLRQLIWLAFAAAILSTVVAIIQHSMALFAADFAIVLRDNLWSVTLNETQIGGMLRWRLILIVLAAGVHALAVYTETRAPEFVRPLWLVNLFVTSAILLTLSLTSHAAGATLWNIGAVAVDWLHFAATSAWVGGLIGLSIAIPVALNPLNQTAQGIALAAVLRHFSLLAIIAVSVLIVTGMFSAAIQLPGSSDVPTSSYGQTLIVKSILVLPLLLLGLYHQRLVAGNKAAGAMNRVVGSVRLEAVLGLPILIAAALLSSVPPPSPPPIPAADTQEVKVSGLYVQMLIDPAAVGANVYEVQISEGGAPLTGAKVWLRFVYPALDRRSALLRAEDSGAGLYVTAGDELSRAGDWLVLVDVIRGDGTADRAAFTRPIAAASILPGARQPGLVNWLTLLGVFGSVSGWVGLAIWRWARRLRWHRESVIIGVFMTLACILLVVLGGWMVDQSLQRADQLRNPTPSIINVVFPNAESVAEGRSLYLDCKSCGSSPQAASILAAQVEKLKDVEIYLLLEQGTEPLLPRGLSPEQRWHVINYLRSAAFLYPKDT